MASRWDEQYTAWLEARTKFRALLPPPGDDDNKEMRDRFTAAKAEYETAAEDLFKILRPTIKRAAVFTIGSWPAIAACTDADDLAAGVEYSLIDKPPKENTLSEAYIRTLLKHKAYDLKEGLARSPVVPLDPPGRDGDENLDGGSRIPPPLPDSHWPWFATLPEPARGNIALFKYIQEKVDDDNDARIYSLTGWFSGRIGDGIRQKNRREIEWAKDNGLDSALSQTGRVRREDINLLNAEMLGAHSALTVSVRTLCPKPCKEKNPFPADSVAMMSQETGSAPDVFVRDWVIGCLSGREAAVPDDLATSVRKFLGAKAEEADRQYFRDCVSLYLRAYCILLLPLKGGDVERHWTDLAAPMTPAYGDLEKYRARAKSYHCLEMHLPKNAEGNHAHD